MQRLKTMAKWLVLLFFLGVLPVLIQTYSQTPEVQTIISFLKENQLLFVSLLVLIKALSIIYPPMPGALFTLTAVPVVGWVGAYALDFIGSVSGAIISYKLGSIYGYPILHWLMGDKLTKKILSYKVKPDNQIVSMFMLRIAVGGVLSDGLCWGASLIGLRFLPFVVGYISSHIVTNLPIFYFVGRGAESKSWLLVSVIAALAWYMVVRNRSKYFEIISDTSLKTR